ncbi:MAG: AAA family ATPase [bacterium]|nr:AAA family ATPase [bacterium]
MSKIISIINQKGGVGKTTTAINLGSYLAHLGKRVLLVDIDPQANATSGLGIDQSTIESGIYESLIGDAVLSQSLKRTLQDNFKVAPATMSLAGAGIELVNLPRREFRLEETLNNIRDEFDFIIVDSPPSLGLLTINGLVAADEILIPIQSEYFALEGLGHLLHTISLVQSNLKPNLGIMGAVITMYDSRNRLSRDVMNELYQYFPNKVFRSVIPRSVRLAEAPSFGRTILHYDPRSKGARAYEKLAREVVGLEKNLSQ